MNHLLALPKGEDPIGERPRTLKEVEKDAIIAAMKKARGNMFWAKKILGIGRETLYRKLRKHGIPRHEYTVKGNRRRPKA